MKRPIHPAFASRSGFLASMGVGAQWSLPDGLTSAISIDMHPGIPEVRLAGLVPAEEQAGLLPHACVVRFPGKAEVRPAVAPCAPAEERTDLHLSYRMPLAFPNASLP